MVHQTTTFTKCLLFVAIYTTLPSTIDAQLPPDLLIKLAGLINAKDIPTLRSGLIEVIESESFEGIPINPYIAKAFVNTTDVMQFMGLAFSFQDVFDAVGQKKDPMEAFIGSLNFDVLERITDIPAFFSHPNVSRVINGIGIPADLLEAVLVNINMSKFFGAVKLVEAYRLFKPNNTLTQAEKVKAFVKIANFTDIVNSVHWSSLLKNTHVLKYLEMATVPGNATGLAIAVIKSIDLDNVARNGVDFEGLIADYKNGSSQPSAIISKRLDFNVLLASLNVTKFMAQDNIEQILKQYNIDPRMVNLLTHVEMKKFVKASQMGHLIKIYMAMSPSSNSSANVTTTTPSPEQQQQILQVLNRINNAALIESVEWSALKQDKAFVSLVEEYVPSYADVVTSMDLQKLARGMDFKGLLKDMIQQPNNFEFDFQTMQKYADLSQVMSGVDLGLLIQTYLKANTTLSLSKKCQAAFVDMTFPLPVLTPETMAGLNALNALNHPLLQCE